LDLILLFACTCLQWIDIAGADTHRFELQQKWSTENLVFINFLKKKNLVFMFILFLIDLNCYKEATKMHTKILFRLNHG